MVFLAPAAVGLLLLAASGAVNGHGPHSPDQHDDHIRRLETSVRGDMKEAKHSSHFNEFSCPYSDPEVRVACWWLTLVITHLITVFGFPAGALRHTVGVCG